MSDKNDGKHTMHTNTKHLFCLQWAKRMKRMRPNATQKYGQLRKIDERIFLQDHIEFILYTKLSCVLTFHSCSCFTFLLLTLHPTMSVILSIFYLLLIHNYFHSLHNIFLRSVGSNIRFHSRKIDSQNVKWPSSRWLERRKKIKRKWKRNQWALVCWLLRWWQKTWSGSNCERWREK